ncbi:MAG TPA: hypothetical protein VGA69_10185 [Nitriliruptorales bacterium]
MATEVPVTEYRANLRHWHARVLSGEEIVVTENGNATVKVTSATTESLFDRWEREGRLRRPTRRRPTSEELPRIRAEGFDSTAWLEENR